MNRAEKLAVLGVTLVVTYLGTRLIPKKKRKRIKSSIREIYKDTLSAMTEGACRAVEDCGGYYNGHKLYIGPRGGMYYVTYYGTKVYV